MSVINKRYKWTELGKEIVVEVYNDVFYAQCLHIIGENTGWIYGQCEKIDLTNPLWEYLPGQDKPIPEYIKPCGT